MKFADLDLPVETAAELEEALRPTKHYVSATPNAKGWAAPLIQVTKATEGWLVEDAHFHQLGGKFLMIGPMHATHRNTTITGCIFEATGSTTTDSLSRMYDMEVFKVHKNIFRNVSREHALYWELGRRGGSISDNLFENIASQAIQFRQDEVPYPIYPAWNYQRVVLISRNIIRQCSLGGARPAFPISPKSAGPGSTIIIEDNVITGAAPAPVDSANHFSFGAICIEAWGSAEIKRNYINLRRPKYPVIQAFERNAGLKDPNTAFPLAVPLLLLEGNHIEEGTIDVRLDKRYTRKVIMQGNMGKAILRIMVPTPQGDGWLEADRFPVTRNGVWSA